MSLSRRHLLQSASAVGALALIGCDRVPVADNPSYGPEIETQIAKGSKAVAVLKTAQDFMLQSYPETSSSMGIDKEDYANLRAKLTDRSPDGQAAIATQTRELSNKLKACLLYTSPSPRDRTRSRMPSSA